MSDVKTTLIATTTAIIAAGITSALLNLTRSAEGKVLPVYKDPVGIPTVCYGHTGLDVKPGMRATDVQCEAWLRQDLMHAQALVDRCFDKTRLSQAQHDALTDAMFNIGPGRAGVKDGLCELKRGGPSTLRRLVNSGQCRAAADQFLYWSNAVDQHGVKKRLPGLVARNEKRRAMFLQDCQ